MKYVAYQNDLLLVRKNIPRGFLCCIREIELQNFNPIFNLTKADKASSFIQILPYKTIDQIIKSRNICSLSLHLMKYTCDMNDNYLC